MLEDVRLVIWDLDDTYWKGTLTEGGIAEYVGAHHDIVITLARRGIVSSICSKNDESTVRAILAKHDIQDFFVFSSISWEPKGPRISALIENIHLRPATVLFIDDNPGNRAEAAAFVPGLQIADETFISEMLADSRFCGKSDPKLTRLAQYRLLERRETEQAAAVSNLDFLRQSNIRVSIEHDVDSNIDRAVELINRTNQLNYTKKRLSDDVKLARAELGDELRAFNRQAGLVRVVDNYGDYGFIGFYMLQNRRSRPSSEFANQTLVHFCFSCRTLGMAIERWVYEWLRRPEINIVGDVLTDLGERRAIDWIKLSDGKDGENQLCEAIAPEVRIYGGCEAHAISHYLGARTQRLTVSGNFASGGLFVRINGVSLLLSSLNRAGDDFKQEAGRLKLPYDLMVSKYFENASDGCVFVFSGGLDALRVHRYRHRQLGWEIMLDADAAPGFDFGTTDDSDLRRRLSTSIKNDSVRNQVLEVISHVRENYDSVDRPTGDYLESLMRDLLQRVPFGSKMLLVLDAERFRSADGTVAFHPGISNYNELVRRIVRCYDYAGVASFADAIESDEELQEATHYERTVYLRLANKMTDMIRQLPARIKPA